MPVTPLHPAKPRVPFSRAAQLRLAYELHGWKVIALLCPVLIFVLFTARFGRGPFFINQAALNEAATSDGAVFQTEILYAAAHGYAANHQGKLPPVETWQTELRPYLARAGAANVLLPQSQKRRFVMNRDLANASLSRAAETPETLLFWRAQTNETDLPPADRQTTGPPFLGVTASGVSVVATPQGKGKLLLLRPAEYSQPSRHAQPYN